MGSDGHNDRKIAAIDLQQASLRQNRRWFQMFHASIADNLRYARAEATAEELEQAGRAAQIRDFIAGLPQGYATLVGERGYRLSAIGYRRSSAH
jgi:ATP-binding cassette subfamily B protein